MERITVDADLKSEVKSYNPIGFYADKINDGRVKWSGGLRKDREFEIKTVE
jgi:hypothetical protein